MCDTSALLSTGLGYSWGLENTKGMRVASSYLQAALCNKHLDWEGRQRAATLGLQAALCPRVPWFAAGRGCTPGSGLLHMHLRNPLCSPGPGCQPTC